MNMNIEDNGINEKLTEVLVELTDSLGYDHGNIEHLEAFMDARNKIKKLIYDYAEPFARYLKQHQCQAHHFVYGDDGHGNYESICEYCGKVE